MCTLRLCAAAPEAADLFKTRDAPNAGGAGTRQIGWCAQTPDMITAIGFDADDTLWHNENIFEDYHRRFQALLARYHDPKTVDRALFATEMRNLELYGYGVKSFALSSIETAIDLTEGSIPAEELRGLIRMCQEMLAHPVDLLAGVAETVAALAKDYTLLLITKGDLHHQERKFNRSGIAAHFAHLEIVSEKDARTYARILQRLALPAERFLMVGNSLRSDVLPVIELGGHAALVPYPLVWEGEKAEAPPADCGRFHALKDIRELPALVARLNLA
jgi:putative hydrolase of the HAD superfamily